MSNRLTITPMKPIRYLILAISLFSSSCDHVTDPNDPGLKVPWNNGQSIVCFGTSLTAGYLGGWSNPIFVSATTPYVLSKQSSASAADSTSYPALLGNVLRIKVFNQGYIGATTQDALNIVGDSVFTKHPAIVLLEFGANDLLQSIDVETTQRQLARLIDTIRAFGSKVVLISFLYTEMIDSIPSTSFLYSRKADGYSYLAMLEQVGSGHADIFIEKAMKGIYWHSNLMSDALHPNQAGYRIMEDNIQSFLDGTFRRNAMYK